MEHHVVGVSIDKQKVRVVCACGWKTPAQKSETKARQEHDKHMKAKHGRN